MPRGNKDNHIREVLAEQLRLREAEKEILSMIEKINLQLNQLVIEELQFKSNQITSELMVTEIDTKPTNAEIVATFDSEFVNQQLLDETLLNCTNNEMEEEDDDESLLNGTNNQMKEEDN